MIYVKFNNQDELIEVPNLIRINDNVMCLPNVEPNENGFITFIDDEQVGDFSDYATIYRVKDNDVYLSNDGSVYENPKANININFDSELDIPTEVKVILNSKEEVILTSPWTKEIEYVEGECPFIESADDIANYDKSIDGLIVSYNYIAKEEKSKREITRLKKELSETDYEAIKYSEGWFTDEEYAPIKAMRESLREQIRALESE